MIHITVFRLITVLLSPATVPISLKKQDIHWMTLQTFTWSKFEEIGKDIHEKTGKYLLTSEATGGDTLMMMIQSCGANFVNEDGEVISLAMRQLRNVSTFTQSWFRTTL